MNKKQSKNIKIINNTQQMQNNNKPTFKAHGVSFLIVLIEKHKKPHQNQRNFLLLKNCVAKKKDKILK